MIEHVKLARIIVRVIEEFPKVHEFLTSGDTGCHPQHLVDTIADRILAKEEEKAEDFPRAVCLCGSARFWRTFQEAGLKETMAGRIVLSIGAASGTDDEHFGNLPKEEYDRVKEMLDQLHLRKIELADEVLILDVDGYIGPSTSRELAYARKLGKVVRFWEQEAAARAGGG